MYVRIYVYVLHVYIYMYEKLKNIAGILEQITCVMYTCMYACTFMRTIRKLNKIMDKRSEGTLKDMQVCVCVCNVQVNL